MHVAAKHLSGSQPNTMHYFYEPEGKDAAFSLWVIKLSYAASFGSKRRFSSADKKYRSLRATFPLYFHRYSIGITSIVQCFGQFRSRWSVIGSEMWKEVGEKYFQCFNLVWNFIQIFEASRWLIFQRSIFMSYSNQNGLNLLIETLLRVEYHESVLRMIKFITHTIVL